ncbi:MAG TPA: NADAR family protein [Solirubrobacteraceae bacterium]|nr:NADAR family protein [Solirubrobacteraceae bacterium]
MSDQMALEVESPILEFRGEFEFLSNFYRRPVTDRQGMRYASAEHAFQASKTTDPDDKVWIMEADTPGQAKRRGSPNGEGGRKIELRENWDQVRVATMVAVLRAKFRPGSPLSTKLLATGQRVLVEGNAWNDTTWGATWRTGTLPVEVPGERVWAARGAGEPIGTSWTEPLVGQNLLGRSLMLVRAELDTGMTPRAR